MERIKGVIEYIRLQKDESLWGIAEFKASPKETEKLLPRHREVFRNTIIDMSGLSFPVVGVWPCILADGMEFSVEGEFKRHSSFGWQFVISSAVEELPHTNDGLMAYLSSGMVKGIGPSIARRIFDKFPDPLTVFENNIDYLKTIDGIGEKNFEKIKKSWEENGQMRSFVGWAVEKAGMTTGLATKAFKKWGGRSQYEIEVNPWVLAELKQVGFAQADLIAHNLGVSPESPKRIEAGIKFVLSQAESPGGLNHSKGSVKVDIPGGQSFLPYQVMVDATSKILDVDSDKIESQLKKMLDEGQRRFDFDEDFTQGSGVTVQEVVANGEPETAIYLTRTHRRETRVAQRIALFQQSPVSRILTEVKGWDSEEWKQFFSGLVIKGIKLTDEQQAAVKAALSEKVSILTGGPGSGKTFTLKFIVDWLKDQGLRVTLAAPTGKASKVLSQATGRQASTIHRLLGYNGSQFQVPAYEGEREGLDDGLQPVPDMLIIDETSMVDLWLVDSLLQRVSKKTHVLFVGDEDQLPSVGAGFVLGDFIASGATPVSRLTEVHRQAENSAIVKNARTINRGETDLIVRQPVDKYPDFFIATIGDKSRVACEVVAMATERIPARFGFKPKDIQILTPRNDGETGCTGLNRRMQTILNPPHKDKAEHKTPTCIYREGDPVMQIKNRYNKELFVPWHNSVANGGTSLWGGPKPGQVDVFNGDQGIIKGFAKNTNGKHVFVVEIDGFLVEYTREEMAGNLVLSHAITCHKSQGGQFPVVVIPLTWEHYALLSRKLIYTAITRAKKMVVLVVQPGKDGQLYSGPLGKAIRNNEPNLRHTALDWRLRNIEEVVLK